MRISGVNGVKNSMSRTTISMQNWDQEAVRALRKMMMMNKKVEVEDIIEKMKDEEEIEDGIRS